MNPSSITFGAPVEPFNGYRKELLDKLVGRGNAVDYVGSTVSGTFSNNQHEGHRGKIIDEIAQESSVGIWAAPNVVLLHAGTNDINRNIDVNNAPNRLSDLIGLVFEHSPNAAVIVAQIVPTKTASSTAKVKAYNSAIVGVVNAWVAKGKHIATVDMFSVVDSITDLADDLHPNLKGYTKIAQQWYDAITIADEKGWIVEAGKSQAPPVGVGSDCGANGKWKSRGEIALGPKAYVAAHVFHQNHAVD
jgi:lysophospholipase L1-like esterase